MITNSRGKGIQSNQEGQNKNVPDVITNLTEAAASSSTTTTTTTSRQWSGFRNPRIVRVSRAFGGKDRHSKVSTVRGLRDRRIRLSVPTAIQLYDLQDRLGLSQPSKVIDWLIDATSDDIDKLPPLQMLPHRGSLNTTSQFHLQQQQIMQFNPCLDVNNVPNFFDVNQRISDQLLGKGKTVKSDDDDQGDLARKLFPTGNNNMQPSSIPGLLNNAMGSFNGYFHHNSESPGLSLSQYGGGGHGYSLQPQMDHIMSNNNNNNNNSNGLSFSATSMPMSFGSSQLLPVPVVPSLFGPYTSYITPAVESNICTGGDDHRRHEIRQSNGSHMIQLLSSTSTSSQHFVQNNSLMPSLQYSIGPSATSLRSFPTFMANYPKHLHNSQNDNGSSSQQNKDHSGS